MNASRTFRVMMDDARTLNVDAQRARDAADLIEQLDPRRHDPDTARVLGQLRQMSRRRTELAGRLKLFAIELQGPGQRDQVMQLDEVLARYLDQHDAALQAEGRGA